MRASKYGANRAKNTASCGSASTPKGSGGNTNISAGRISSHNVA